MISKHIFITLLFVAILTTLTTNSCSPSANDGRKGGFSFGKSSKTGGDTAATGGDDGSKSGKGDGGQESVQVAGAGLVPLTIDNAQTRCAFVDLKNNNYDVSCFAVVISPSGAEFKAVSTAPGVKISWDLPKSIAGAEITTAACKIDPNGLAQNCEVNVASPIPTKVQTDMKVVDTLAKRDKVTSGTVVLSVSISVFGQNISAPMSFQVDSSGGSTSTVGQLASAKNDELFGFQPLLYDPLRTSFPGLSPTNTGFVANHNQIAVCGTRAYFTTDHFIFVTDSSIKGNANTWLYAGSPNQSNKGDLSHRLSHAFPYINSIACGKDVGELYVVEKYSMMSPVEQRILHIFESGPISLVASSKKNTFSGDLGSKGSTGLATDAGFTTIEGIATDSKFNLFVCDNGNNRIRRIDTKGFITTIAGTGASNDAGDGGPAINAAVSNPQLITVGPDDSIYFLTVKNVIRRIDPKGQIATIVGYTTPPANGADLTLAKNYQLGLTYGMSVASDNSLYLTQTDPAATAHTIGKILKVTSAGKITTVVGDLGAGFAGDGGPASQAKIDCPSGIATIPDGSVIFPDSCNYRIRAIDKSGIINTVIGNGGISYDGDSGSAAKALLIASGVAFGNDGSLFLSDSANNRIRKISSSGIISTIAGSGKSFVNGDGEPKAGAALAARLTAPNGIVFSNKDNSIYFVNGGNTIQKIDASGLISKVAGGSNCSTQTFGPFTGKESLPCANLGNNLSGLAIQSDGSLLVTANYEGFVHRINLSGVGTIVTIAGVAAGTDPSTLDPQIALKTQLFRPTGVTALADGSVLVFDTLNQVIRRINTNGTTSIIAGQLGKFGDSSLGEGGAATNALLDMPNSGVALPDGRIYFSETGMATGSNMGRIKILTPDSSQGSLSYTISTLAGNTTGMSCGGGSIQKNVDDGRVQQALQTSLASICLATPQALAIQNNCTASSNPNISIAVSQIPAPTGGQYSSALAPGAGGSIILMKLPCLNN